MIRVLTDRSPMSTPRTALKFEVEVTENGRVELPVPFGAGTRLTVFVIEPSEDATHDLLEASQSSLDFWDNTFDDEDWNNA